MIIIRDIFDSIFIPIIEILDQVINWLSQAGNIARQGFSIENYLTIYANLGDGFISIIQNLFFVSYIVLLVFMASQGYSLYIRLKEGVKWW